MSTSIHIDKSLNKPIYQQIYDGIIDAINGKIYLAGAQLPSINQIARENNLARETVVKAFRLLQEKGIVRAVHGKGFFITSNKTKAAHHVFLMLDTLSAYKEVLFEAIQKEFGEEAIIEIYFHHFNPKTFKTQLNEAAGNYTAYLVIPFDNPTITEMLDTIPSDKLYLIDRWPRFYKNKFVGVYQDFYNDVQKALEPFTAKMKSYRKLVLVFRDLLTELPIELQEGFEEFCYQNKIEYQVINHAIHPNDIQKHVAYLTLDDDDLVRVIEKAGRNNWKIGKDVGVLSYNDTPLKKVVASGISVISTDFEEMGKQVAQLVINNRRECIANSGALTDRGSF